MNRSRIWWRIATLAVLAVLVLDVLAATLRRTAGTRNVVFAYAPWLIIAAAGFFGRRAGLTLFRSTLLGVWIALIEASIGWAMTWWIGSAPVDGLPTAGMITYAAPRLIAYMLPYVVLVAPLLATAGAIAGGMTLASKHPEA
jgi:hypothetical protein